MTRGTKVSRMRKVAALTAAALVLGASAAAAQDRYDPDDALDTDDLDFDVDLACPSDPGDLPEGVTGVGRGGDGIYRYVAPVEVFDVDDVAHGRYITPSFNQPFTDSALVVSEGNAYFTLPNDHEFYDIVYVLENGDTHTAAAEFDEDGCIDKFEWQYNEFAPSVEFRDSDGVEPIAAPIESAVGVEVDLSVVTSNEQDDENDYASELADGWKLGFEVEEFVHAGSLTVEVCDTDYDDCDELDTELIHDGNTHVVQVELLEDGEELASGDNDTLHVRATFGEVGVFAGQVFLFGDPELFEG